MFMSEVQTPRCLDEHNLRFLAQKIFDEPDINGDFDSRNVTWAQFNKEVLPGRSFTFWQWFDGVMELTKKHLKNYWTDRLIFGFIGKQYLHLLLQQSQDGTFLLRFSDSEIGGITIPNKHDRNRQILNIQPFTKKDLEIRSLGDRIHDIEFIHFVYPNRRKDEAFNKYYTGENVLSLSGTEVMHCRVTPSCFSKRGYCPCGACTYLLIFTCFSLDTPASSHILRMFVLD
uniref:SH2 domain-containing protein n=1 Tax=Erpetoichthys calabaricus TaxID=27687 RepID=A0A8C4SWY4_ERPCA